MSAPIVMRTGSAQVRSIGALRCESGRAPFAHPDEISVEEPLEIRIAGETLAVTMRTPGHDHELSAGFLLAEGIIASRADLGTIAHCGHLGSEGYGNAIDVLPAPGTTFDVEVLTHARRGTLMSSACGVCGRGLIDDLVARLPVATGTERFERSFIAALPDELRRQQPVFARTGGLHAAGIARPGEGILAVREDIGRHNAVDKVIGRLLLDDRLGGGGVLVVSGRTSFEIVQKAAAGGLSGVVGVSAPSSLSVSTAARAGLLLCGFARHGNFNVYAGEERLC